MEVQWTNTDGAAIVVEKNRVTHKTFFQWEELEKAQ